MKDAEKALKVLTAAQLAFIEAELSVCKEDIQGMDDDALSNLYDKICDIEVEETMAADAERGGEYSERERLAESIVTAIGNELYTTAAK